MLTVSFDPSDKVIQGMLAGIAHVRGAVTRAMARAINLTLRASAKDAVTLAQTVYTVRARDLLRKTRLERATTSDLRGRMMMRDKRGMNLIRFQARPNRPGSRPKAGASVKVLRQGSRKHPMYKSRKAFVFRGLNGHVLLGVRTKRGSGGIRAFYGPHPIQALFRDESRKKLEKKVAATLPVHLAREVDAALDAAAKQLGGKR